jgi:hypothetical protein
MPSSAPTEECFERAMELKNVRLAHNICIHSPEYSNYVSVSREIW